MTELVQAQSFVMRPLQWSEEREPCKDIRYNHVVADSGLGRISIEWKGWKERDGRAVYLDGNYLDTGSSLEEAKAIANHHLHAKVLDLVEGPVSAHPAQTLVLYVFSAIAAFIGCVNASVRHYPMPLC